jgi:hypothetical protein
MNLASFYIKPFNSLVSGSIFNNTSEYLTFAFTQEPRGAAALDTLEMVDYSKLIGVDSIHLGMQ